MRAEQTQRQFPSRCYKVNSAQLMYLVRYIIASGAKFNTASSGDLSNTTVGRRTKLKLNFNRNAAVSGKRCWESTAGNTVKECEATDTTIPRNSLAIDEVLLVVELPQAAWLTACDDHPQGRALDRDGDNAGVLEPPNHVASSRTQSTLRISM